MGHEMIETHRKPASSFPERIAHVYAVSSCPVFVHSIDVLVTHLYLRVAQTNGLSCMEDGIDSPWPAATKYGIYLLYIA